MTSVNIDISDPRLIAAVVDALEMNACCFHYADCHARSVLLAIVEHMENRKPDGTVESDEMERLCE